MPGTWLSLTVALAATAGDATFEQWIAQDQRASKSFVLLRFTPLGRWRSAAPWIRRLEGDRLLPQPPP